MIDYQMFKEVSLCLFTSLKGYLHQKRLQYVCDTVTFKTHSNQSSCLHQLRLAAAVHAPCGHPESSAIFMEQFFFFLPDAGAQRACATIRLPQKPT